MEKYKPKIVAIIPCYNTEAHVYEVVSKARQYVDQVIVVDDGSTDDTASKAEGAGATVIRNKCNLGKGAAMKEAALVASGDIIVFLDGDGQHDPAEIPAVIKPITSQEYEFVIGSRHLSGSKISYALLQRRLPNMVASLIISVVTNALLPLVRLMKYNIHIKSLGSKVKSLFNYYTKAKTKRIATDCTSGFRAIRTNRWQELELTSDGYQIETEMLYEIRKHRIMLTEVPISCSWNGSISNLSVIGDGWKTLKMLGSKLLSDFRTM